MSAYDKAKAVVQLTISKGLLYNGDLSLIDSEDGLHTEFDVAGLFNTIKLEQWPDATNLVAVENFRQMVLAEFERRWGVWADGSGGDRAYSS